MARTETFRIQLIIPRDSSSGVVSTFQDLFYEANGSILYPPEELDQRGMEVHVSRILEDLEKHRPDIESIKETVTKTYPEHDFYTFKQGAMSADDAFFDYSKDIIIGACNGSSDGSSVSAQVPIGRSLVREEPLPVVDGIYVTVTEPNSETDGCDVVGVDINKNAERWRIHEPLGGHASYLKQHGEQIIVSFQAGIGVYNAELGDTIWNMTWDELLPDQMDIESRDIAHKTVTVGSEDTAYVGSEDGTIFAISLQDGQARRVTTIDGTISELVSDTNHDIVFAINGIDAGGEEDEAEEKRSAADDAENGGKQIDTDWAAFRRTDDSPIDYNVVAVSLNGGRRLWSAALGTGKKGRTPATGIEVAINRDIVVFASLNDEIIGYKQTTGDVCWRLTQQDAVDAIESNSEYSKGGANLQKTSFGVKTLRTFEHSLYASTSLGLLKLEIENGKLQWQAERKQLRIVTDGQLICSEVESLISTLHGRSVETCDSGWSFDVLSPFAGKGLASYGSKIIVSANGKCLIVDVDV